MILNPEGLTGRQALFAREYVKDLSPRKAAARAGYSDKSARNQGTRLMQNDAIVSFIGHLMDNAAKDLGISHRKILSDIMDAIEECKKDKPKGNPLGVMKGIFRYQFFPSLNA